MSDVLRSRTPAAWAEAVAAEPVDLLSDHAHCELKAAASAMTLLKKNEQRPGLALRLAPLVKEEADHLHRVLRELDARGGTLGPDRPNPYVRGLWRAAGGRGSDEEAAYLDNLLVNALIELRSHERFAALRACDALAGLHPLYDALAEAEARHGDLFLELAREHAGEAAVGDRLGELAEAEAALIEGLPFAPRIHSGPPSA